VEMWLKKGLSRVGGCLEWVAKTLHLINARLEGIRLKSARLKGTRPEGTRLEGAHLEGTRL
jgi:uncharacterized protein YjbI with pentapeptide repeats